MTSVIKAITKFQNVALITTAGAVAYWYANEAHENSAQEGAEALKSAAPETNTKNAHDLKGQVVDKEKQGLIARAVDTDCEYCLDTRRKLFGFFRAAEKEAESKTSK